MKFKKYFNFFILKLLFIIFDLSESISLFKSTQRSSNMIIRAEIGQTVNISCWFEPSKLIFRNRLEESENDDFLNSNVNYRLKKRKKRSDKAANKKLRKIRSIINHQQQPQLHRPRHHRTTRKIEELNIIESFNTKQMEEDVESANSFISFEGSENNNEANTDKEETTFSSNNINNNNKFEVDWYFLDKQGRMNIISYGNKTTSNIKYKTYFTSANTRSIADNLNFNNDMSYSSSALYSQQSSRSMPRTYAHYLNVLIESEEDEGVYQCINPDWPNFIIQNVTVQISRNTASSSTQNKHLIFLISFYLFYLYEKCFLY